MFDADSIALGETPLDDHTETTCRAMFEVVGEPIWPAPRDAA